MDIKEKLRQIWDDKLRQWGYTHPDDGQWEYMHPDDGKATIKPKQKGNEAKPKDERGRPV